MKTLIHIIPTLENGGAETVLSRLVEEFAKDGVKQFVISLQGNENDFNHAQIAGHCTVIHAKENSSVVREIFLNHPEAKIVAWMYKSILKAHQWRSKFSTDHKIIWNIRRSSFRPKEIYHKASLFFFGIYSKWMKTSIIYCAFQAEIMHNRYGFYKGKSKVIQNRLAKKVELDNIGNSGIEGEYVLYVGRHNHAKGPDRLLDIAQTFLPKNPAFSLVIAGSGWTKEMIPSSLTKQVILLGNVKELVPLYTHATALLFTSYTEGYPNVLVEAAVCGTPVIGFPAGDSPSILADHSLGELVSSKTDFCLQLQQQIKIPPSLKERDNASKMALANFNFTQTYQAYHNFIFP